MVLYLMYLFFLSVVMRSYERCSKHEMKRLTVDLNSFYDAFLRYNMY